MTQQFNVGIFGASGYTGAECIRLLAGHPAMNIKALTADRKAGQTMASVYPHLRHLDLPVLQKLDDVDVSSLDLVFFAMPHGLSQSIVKELKPGVKVVDMGADFRLEDPASYEKWYDRPHDAPEKQPDATYGLTEFYREDIAKAGLVACTGCNAATVQYALRPLLEAKVIDPDRIICDLKNGLSGAGRSLKEHLLFCEATNNSKAYAVGGTHRHLGEFDQEFSRIVGRDVQIQFTPHLVPINRGILATSYVDGDAEAIHAALTAAYADEQFIITLPFGQTPSLADATGSNYCHIGVSGDRIKGRATIVATLDNLCKGSAGQAVQNANLMLGLDEATALTGAPVFP